MWFLSLFFFQAEDGIRDLTVTGVQTCALPICRRWSRESCAFRDKSQWPCRPLDRRRQRERLACWLLEPGYVVSTVLKRNRIASAYHHFGFEPKTPAMSALQSADGYRGALSRVFSQTPSDSGDG